MNLPVAKQRVQEQIMVHLQYLMQNNPTAAKQLAQMIAGMEKVAGQWQSTFQTIRPSIASMQKTG